MFIFHLEDHHFQSPDFLNFYFYFLKSTMIQKWPKMRKYSQQASHNAWYRDGTIWLSTLAQKNQSKWLVIASKMTSPSSCVLFTLIIIFAQTLFFFKFRVFLKHSEKIQVLDKHSEKFRVLGDTLKKSAVLVAVAKNHDDKSKRGFWK